jgi:hypothetical protein
MSTHSGFALAAALSLVITLPSIVWTWRKRRPHRMLVLALYAAGYGLIAAALLLDPIVQPPLFVHGFVPGIGGGLIITALALTLQDVVTRRRKATGHRSESW